MRLLLLLFASLLTANCQHKGNYKDPICGNLGINWKAPNDVGTPHHNIEHKIEITHANQTIVNNKLLDDIAIKAFLEEEAKLRLAAYIYLDFDAHANCKIVKRIATSIESSGICEQNICIIGYDYEIPPPNKE